MNSPLFALFTLFAELLKPKYDAKLAFLKFQNQMLRARIGMSRIAPIPEEREELLRLGEIRGVSAFHVPQSVFRAAASVRPRPLHLRPPCVGFASFQGQNPNGGGWLQQ